MSKQFESLGTNIYRKTANAKLYGRFTINDRRTFRLLKSITLTEARKERTLLQSDHDRANMGLCDDPFEPKKPTHTLASLAAIYTAAGLPDTRRRLRTGTAHNEATRQLNAILQHLGRRDPLTLTRADLHQYHTRRIAQIQSSCGPGHRTVELEINILSNLLTWATNHGHLKENPIRDGRPTFRHAEDIKSCNQYMPDSDDELHTLAHFFFDGPRSTHALGWQLLLEALTGCRTSEILRLRWSASKTGPTAEAGYKDDHALYIARAKKGIHPYILLETIPGHTPLRQCLTALRNWHTTHYRWSPWMLPGRDGTTPPDKKSLTHALQRATNILNLPKRTSHGLRAYHVRALRSMGIDDSEIAKRLGHRSGVALVERTYGVSEPGWFNSGVMNFLPTPVDKLKDSANAITPAWERWLPDTPEAAKIIPAPTPGIYPANAQVN